MAWLLLFGMIHGYLLWSGDILVCYALCGMVIWFFRKRDGNKLLWPAVIFFLIPMVLSILSAYSMPYWDKESRDEMLMIWSPDAEYLAQSVAYMQGSWLEQMKVRVAHTISMQTTVFYFETGWRVISMMLLGMFLFKKGILIRQTQQVLLYPIEPDWPFFGICPVRTGDLA